MNPEDELRHALNHRADEVEPGPDAYARLAEKVTAANRRPAPWWQSPKLLWLSAAGATAVALVVLGIAAFSGDDGDQVATPPAPTSTPAPGPTAEATPSLSATPMPTPTVIPNVVSPPEAVWPIGTPDGSWPSSAGEAVVQFYEDVLGLQNVPLGAIEAPAGSGVTQLLALNRGEDDGRPGDEVANFVLVEVEPAQWGIVDISSPVIIEAPADGRIALDGFDPTVFAEGIDGPVDITLVGVAGRVIARGQVETSTDAEGGSSGGSLEILAPAYSGPALLVASAGDPIPSVGVVAVEVAPAAGNPGPPVPGSEGPPAGVIWPIDSLQPFGEWPSEPEAAAQVFVDTVAGWDLEVASVTFLDPIAMIADVELAAVGEDGEPFGVATRVRVLGGVSESGEPQWGVFAAWNDRIVIDRVFSDRDQFRPSGQGLAFEATIDVALVTATGETVGSGFVMGGGVEPAPLSGTVTITESLPGPGYAVFADLGGLGLPSAITIVRLELPELVERIGAGPCSTEGIVEPAEQDGLPPAVAFMRNAIIAAALNCDYDALADLAGEDFAFSFGAGGDPASYWELLEDEGQEPLRFLVELLARPFAEDGTAGTTYYVWPDVFLLPWDDVLDSQRDVLRPLYDDDDFVIFGDFGGYVGWRIAIDDRGDWIYFVAGD